MSPLSDAPLGYLMTQFSVTASVQKLNVDKFMGFDFNLQPIFNAPDWWKLSELYKDQIQVGTIQFTYDTRYTLSLLPDLLALASLLIVITLLGYLFVNRTERWLDIFSRQLTYQLDQLVEFARDVFTGKPVKIEFNANRGNEIDTVMKTLETLLSEQAIAQERLRKLAHEDALTGLPTFSRFRESVQNRLESPDAKARPMALLFIDIDKLKHINDVYGYAIGDKVVQQAALILQQFLPEPSMISRRTGDEFIACVDMDTSQLQRITDTITQFEMEHQGISIPISMTVGAAIYPQDAQTLNDLIFCAEYALKQAKQLARQSFVIFDIRLGQRLIRIKQIEERIGPALKGCQIKPFYQPEVDMVTGKITGVEALARWHDPLLGWVSPDEFVPIIEQLRLSTKLTQHLLGSILKDAKQIRARFPEAKVAFNVAPEDFRDNQLIETIEAYTSDLQPIGLSGLEIELTEQDIVDLDIDMLAKLDKLIEMGVRVAIDDFGTRYSSLSRLTDLPLHRLKIDHAFVANIATEKGEEVIRLIISLAKALDLDLTAEGVESIHQRDLLIELGCINAQGWLYQKALPLEELLQLPQILTLREHAV
jgi:diguanylate cyclase (GGDEF)-like protein